MSKIQNISYAVLLSIILTGCAATQQHEKELAVSPETLKKYTDNKPPKLQRLYARLPKEGERNTVLNNNRIGLAALELGENKLAAAALDNSISHIDSFYTNNPQAEKALNLFFKENAKDFKGDAYERAMTFYYRGLVYLREGDYENARASFKAGMLQDSFAEQEKYRADFASLAFLEGWASQCLGDYSQAKERFAEAHALNPKLPIPSPKDNFLVVFETGKAPKKIAKGTLGESLGYERGQSTGLTRASVRVGNTQSDLIQAEDIYWQATTRGGREIDTVLKGKSNFKETTGDVAEISGLASAGMIQAAQQQAAMGNYDAGNASLMAASGGLLFSAANSIISEATRPDVDIRYWDNLPEKITLTTLSVQPNTKKVEIISKNKTAKQLTANWSQAKGFAWGREVSALAIPDSAPGAVADVSAPTDTSSKKTISSRAIPSR